MKLFPMWNFKTLDDALKMLTFIVRERQTDVVEYVNLQQRFMAGRKVGRVPSAGNDVTADDKLGDFNVTTTYRYDLVDNSGTAEWVRSAVATW